MRYSPSGELVWTARWPTGGNVEAPRFAAARHAVFADRGGRVYAVSEDAALSLPGEDLRIAFPGFDLPHLDRDERLSLEDPGGGSSS